VEEATLQPLPRGPKAFSASTAGAAPGVARLGNVPQGLRSLLVTTADWQALRQAATIVAANAYAPYSNLRVGAAGLTSDGQVVTGCNVENASYGLTLCAECGLVSALHARGSQSLVAVAVVAGDGQPLTPCGRCRQLLLEHGGPDLLVDTGQGPVSLSELLPGAFNDTELASRRETAP
jgi:cytidine deaminase